MYKQGNISWQATRTTTIILQKLLLLFWTARQWYWLFFINCDVEPSVKWTRWILSSWTASSWKKVFLKCPLQVLNYFMLCSSIWLAGKWFQHFKKDAMIFYYEFWDKSTERVFNYAVQISPTKKSCSFVLILFQFVMNCNEAFKIFTTNKLLVMLQLLRALVSKKASQILRCHIQLINRNVNDKIYN